MFHYLMNFRSRFGRELKTNVRRKVITENQHENGNSELSQISDSLKEAKTIMTERNISVKPQSQGVMIDQHQKWEHKIEWP